MTGNKRHSRQKGLYVVEFAIVSGIFFFMMFAAMEVARLMYVWSALDAMTQRGARLAAVCPIGDANVTSVAIFDDGGGNSIVPGMTAANIGVRYLTENGNPTNQISSARMVEVSIQNYTHQTLIPELITGFISPLLTAPAFTTTRPVESLGRNPSGAAFC